MSRDRDKINDGPEMGTNKGIRWIKGRFIVCVRCERGGCEKGRFYNQRGKKKKKKKRNLKGKSCWKRKSLFEELASRQWTKRRSVVWLDA